jgi:hypothetical protein
LLRLTPTTVSWLQFWLRLEAGRPTRVGGRGGFSELRPVTSERRPP